MIFSVRKPQYFISHTKSERWLLLNATPTASWESKFTLQTRNVSLGSLLADVLWSSSRIHFSPTDVRWGEMNAWQTKPKGRLRGGQGLGGLWLNLSSMATLEAEKSDRCGEVTVSGGSPVG